MDRYENFFNLKIDVFLVYDVRFLALGARIYSRKKYTCLVLNVTPSFPITHPTPKPISHTSTSWCRYCQVVHPAHRP